MGRARARALGAEPSDAGFVCDLFGHIGQMPQLLKLFGMRGIRLIDADRDPQSIRERFDAYVKAEAEATRLDPVLLFDGADHQRWDRPVYNAVAGKFGREEAGFKFAHSSLDAYLDEMVAQSERIRERRVGELREPGNDATGVDKQALIPGVLSNRVWIKQANTACQNLLSQWAEPITASAWAALGRPVPSSYLDLSWRWLLQNHPHDSICGCSIDEVHRDMEFRFRQSRQIAERVDLQVDMYVSLRPDSDQVERPIRLTQGYETYRELEVETRPQQSWTAVYDGRRGLALVSAGLFESTVRDREDRAVAVTLFRGTRRTVMTDGEPDGQILGPMSFKLLLSPLAQEPDRRALAERGHELVNGLMSVQLDLTGRGLYGL